MDRIPEIPVCLQWACLFCINLAHQISSMTRDRALLAVALAGLIFTGTIDSVLYVRLTHKMDGYEWLLSQIAMTTAFCAISWPITWYQMFVSRTVTTEMRRAHSLMVYMMIGMLDAMAVMIGTIPLPYVDGPVVAVLSKACIPVMMLGSIAFLGTRYRWTHFAGAATILLGVAVNLVPYTLSAGRHIDRDTLSHAFWAILVIAAVVPAAASNLFKEKRLKQAPTNVWHFNAWVALFQLFWGMSMAWTVFVPMPSPATHIRLREFPRYMLDSSMCFLGLVDQNPNISDACTDTWAVFAVFIVFNVIFNVLMLYVFRNGSAVLAIVVGTSTLTLTNLTYHVSTIAGEAYDGQFSPFNLAALGVILVGIVVYNVRPERTARPVDDAAAAAAVFVQGTQNDEAALLDRAIDSDDSDSQIMASPFTEFFERADLPRASEAGSSTQLTDFHVKDSPFCENGSHKRE